MGSMDPRKDVAIRNHFERFLGPRRKLLNRHPDANGKILGRGTNFTQKPVVNDFVGTEVGYMF